MRNERYYSWVDQFCLGLDQLIRTLSGHPVTTGAPYPADNIKEGSLSMQQRKHAAGLMRVNHTGEICAQALYHGHGVISKAQAMKEKMQQAAHEEGNHLMWCQQRLKELDGRTSYLNVLWYAGALSMGVLSGVVGDEWSLGFINETERQVVQHLRGHLQLLPEQDYRSHQVVQAMEQDELKHQEEAKTAGARELPRFIKQCMCFAAKCMVKTAYWV